MSWPFGDLSMKNSFFPCRHIYVLIMPTDFCNMNCIYCFNSHRTKDRDNCINFDTLERIYSIIFPFYSEVRFIWHGDEPLSMGIDFYKIALNLQNKVNRFGVEVTNSIQSNLTLIDDQMAAFLVERGIRVSGSFDGSASEQNRYNTNLILKGYKTLKKAGGHCGFNKL